MSEEQNGKSAEAGTQTEVVAKAKRRHASRPAEYKLRTLRGGGGCPKPIIIAFSHRPRRGLKPTATNTKPTESRLVRLSGLRMSSPDV